MDYAEIVALTVAIAAGVWYVALTVAVLARERQRDMSSAARWRRLRRWRR